MASYNNLLVLLVLLVSFTGLTSSFEVIAPQQVVDILAAQKFTFLPILAASLSASIPPEGITTQLYIPDASVFGCTVADPTPVDKASAKGKVVLLSRGGCTFQEKAEDVLSTGALAAIIYNNQGDTIPSGALAIQGNGVLPIVVEGISMVEGLMLRNFSDYYGNLTIRIYQDPTTAAQKQALKNFWTNCNGPYWNYIGTPYDGWNNDSTDPCILPWTGVTCYSDGSIAQLNLAQSNIIGTITDLSNLTKLQTIDFSQNGLTGTLPEYIGGLKDLYVVMLNTNGISGTIPESYGALPNLAVINLGQNNLTGTVPAGFWALQSITDFSVASNQIHGSLPGALALPNLKTFDISSNLFEGNISLLDVSVLTQVTSFDITSNNIYGSIPEGFGVMNQTGVLRLGSNQLSGDFPASFANLGFLVLLDISNNSFSGSVPAANLPPAIRYFRASRNSFSSLPADISNYYTLVEVDLSYNAFTTVYTNILSRLPVPAGQSDVDSGYCLQYIDFSHNQITTGSPQFQLAINQWPSLVSFKINNNNLNGTLQIFGYNNPFLNNLDLSNNNLGGPIPAELNLFIGLTNINLLNNSFSNMAPANASLSTFLPTGFFAQTGELIKNTTLLGQSGNFSCPNIYLSLVGHDPIRVQIDPYYHGYQLCLCDRNFRRVNITTYNYAAPYPHFAPDFACVACPKQGMTCAGGVNDTEFLIDPGYFPTPSTADPQVLLDCPNCAGLNLTSGAMICTENHGQRLCSKCEEGTFTRGDSHCVKCAPLGGAVVGISVILLVAVVAGFTVFTLIQRQLCGCFNSSSDDSFFSVSSAASQDQLTLKESTSTNATSDTGTGVGGVLVGSSTFKRTKQKVEKSSSVAALLIAINYYQTVSALSQYYNLPVSVNQLLAAVKVVTSVTGSGLGMECLHSSLQTYSNLYVAQMLEPPICLAIVLVVYLVGKLYAVLAPRLPTGLQEWEITCLKMALFVINLLFFPITSAAINAFRCTEDPVTHVSYNSQYPYQKCSDISLVGRVFAVVIYSVGVISLFSWLIGYYIIKTKGGEDQKGTLPYIIEKSFGFFFLQFRDRYFWFAIIILLRRFVISLITSLVKVESVLAFGLNNLVLIVSAFVVLVKRPFRTHIDNLLETTTILCAIFIYGAAVLMDAPGYTYGNVAIEVFYFLVNFLVLLWCGYEFLRTNFPRVLSVWRKITQKRREKMDPTANESL